MIAKKEEVIALEKLLNFQKPIYRDAADVGYVLNRAEKDRLREVIQSLRETYQSEIETWGHKDNSHPHGSSTSIHVTTEFDSDTQQYYGVTYCVEYNFDPNPKTSIINSKPLEFLTVTTKSWRANNSTFNNY